MVNTEYSFGLGFFTCEFKIQFIIAITLKSVVLEPGLSHNERVNFFFLLHELLTVGFMLWENLTLCQGIKPMAIFLDDCLPSE